GEGMADNPGRTRLVAFRADPDPLAVGRAMRLSVIVHLCAVIPFAAALIPGTASVSVPLLLVGGVLYAIDLTVVLAQRRAAGDPVAPRFPSARAYLASILLLTVVLTVLNLAIATPYRWFRIALLFPLVVTAFVGNR